MHHKQIRALLIALTVLTAGLTAVNGLTDPFRLAERKGLRLSRLPHAGYVYSRYAYCGGN